MTTMTDFDRMVASWLETAGPARVDEGVVDTALATARGSRQRRGVLAFVAGSGAWPRRRGVELGAMPRVVRVALVAALLLALVAGSVWVGSQLLKAKPQPTFRGEFIAVATLPEELLVAEVLPLPDGRAWIRTGEPGSEPGPAMIWDPATDRFQTVADTAPNRASAPVVMSDGRFLYFDYADRSSPPPRYQNTFMYEPVTNRWVRAQDIDTSRGSVPVQLADGRVLLAGGSQPDLDQFQPIGSAQIFDPGTGRFEATGSLNTPRASSLTLLHDGRVFVFGGDTSASDESEISTPELFNPASGFFSRVGAPPPLPQDTPGRKYSASWHATPISLADGRVLIPGVSCGEVHDIVSGYSATFWPATAVIFDPRTEAFTSNGVIPHCVNRGALLSTGEVLLIGYYYTSTESVSWAGLFDPATGQTRELDTPHTTGPYYTLVRLADGHLLLVNDSRQLKLFH